MTKSKKTVVEPFDPVEFLDDEETIAGFLAEAFETGDAVEIAKSLGTVARARGMTEIARQAGVSRESLYRALSEKGNPELSTLVKVMRACGVQLSVQPAKAAVKAALRRRKAA
jgi:probable addiction module antidote protein